jgi:adenylate kinase
VLWHGLWSQYDRDRRSFVIEYEGLVDKLREYRGYIIETHWLEPFLDAGVADIIVFTRTHPLVLYKRLSRRDWPKRKIVENVEAELLGSLIGEALEAIRKGALVIEIDTSRLSPEEAVEVVIGAARVSESKCCINWLDSLSPEELEKVMGIIERYT